METPKIKSTYTVTIDLKGYDRALLCKEGAETILIKSFPTSYDMFPNLDSCKFSGSKMLLKLTWNKALKKETVKKRIENNTPFSVKEIVYGGVKQLTTKQKKMLSLIEAGPVSPISDSEDEGDKEVKEDEMDI